MPSGLGILATYSQNHRFDWLFITPNTDSIPNMDRSRFIETSPGRLVGSPVGEWAFVPDPLPPALTEPVGSLPGYAGAMEVVGELRGLTSENLLPNPAVVLRAIQREESLRSSSIEGAYSTAEELLKYELQRERGRGDPEAVQREVHNYELALARGEREVREVGISHDTIRLLHEILMDHPSGEGHWPGVYRAGPVFIGADARFVPPPDEMVEPCLDALLGYIAEPGDDLPPIVRALLVHYQFETIHPFRDGNGRVGRLLLSIMLAEACGLSRPWLHMSDYFERHKGEYVERMFEVSASGAWMEWIGFCLDGVADQGRRVVAQCRGLLGVRTRWHNLVRLEELPQRYLLLADHLLGSPVIDTAKSREVTGVSSAQTARDDLDRLVELGVLERRAETARKNLWYAKEVLRIAHGQG
jgi:Fic family protein